MKPYHYFTFLFIIFAFVKCTQKTETPEVTSVEEPSEPMAEVATNKYKVKDKDTISVATFNLWKDNWKKSVGKNQATKTIQYFTMPVVDFSEVVGEKPAKVRLYLGLDESVDPNVPHLMAVGVDSSGNNMISGDDHVYDITQPCPPGCVGGDDE